MPKALILTEKPSVAKDIARVLNISTQHKGYFENQTYVITWALGHLIELASPDTYDAKYQTWQLEDLPIIPTDMKLSVIKNSAHQYQIIKKLCHRNDVNKVIIATDAGREGELVARWILDYAKVNKPIERLWISSVTQKAIREGFSNLKPGAKYVPLYHAAVARAIADWVVGINATRALTTKYQAQLSAGRVQTPTIALVLNREEEIKAFKPVSYYELIVHANQVRFHLLNATNQVKKCDLESVQLLKSKLNNQNIKVIEIQKNQKKIFSPHLYDLTTLQKEANDRYGYSPKLTLSIVQSLYEYHKVLTYPRTDSKYVSKDMISTFKDRLRAVFQGDLKPVVSNLLKPDYKFNLSCVDDQKVSDHHAIIPTEEPADIMDFNMQEKNIYMMVVKRFIAALYQPYVYEQTTVKTSCSNEVFQASGHRIIELGWKSVYTHQEVVDDDETEDDIQTMPVFKQGDVLKITAVSDLKKTTKPPKYLTEGSLILAMEDPAKHIDTHQKELNMTLKKTGGIGTVATRADIIEKLFAMQYMRIEGKDIKTTSKGRQVLSLAPKELRSPKLTAIWENELSLIEKGIQKKDVFISNIKRYTQKMIEEIKQNTKQFTHDNLSHKTCPNCGKPLLEINHKDKEALKCSDVSCGYRVTVSQSTQSRCPVCHKKLKLHGQGDQAMFICSCGHREKMSSFQSRKKEDKKQMSNKDAKEEVKKINKEADQVKNSALADALKDLLS